ncbi:MAG TPA: Rieske 2Fe-2S domain-containing protein [Roseiarcus sp.]
MTAREDDGASSDWRPVAPAADVVEGRPHAVVVEGNLLVIVRTGETFRAAQGLCPHERGDLSSGRVEGGWLVCPRHLLSFDLGSGAPSKGWGVPALKLYPARKAGEQIEIDAAALRRDPPLGARTVWNLAPGAN